MARLRTAQACLGRRQTPHGESGQLVTGLVVLAALLGVFAIGILLIPLGAATTERSASQAAADAAALAGAKEVGGELQDQLSGSFGDLGGLFDALSSPGTCDAGRPEAQTFARRNGASLTAYCTDWVTGTVQTTVQMSTSATSGAGALAKATASIGFDPSLCTVPANFPPAPSPSPSPSPSSSTSSTTSPTTAPPPPPPPPPPPADAETDIDCGPVTLHVLFDGSAGSFRLSPLGQLDALFDPRLTK